MKKVLFCAAMVAAMSMAFVACGKKDNKNAENQEGGAPASGQQFESHDQGQDEGAAFDHKGCCGDKAAYGEKDAYEYDNAALCEKLVREFEAAVAAGDYERAYQISMEAEQKINPADFTQDQVERIMRAGSLIPEDFINSKM